MKYFYASVLCASALSFFGFFHPANAQNTGPDITVYPQPDSVYGLARVSVAYDGTIYVGRMARADNASFYRNWEVLSSTDKGATFTRFAKGRISTGRYTAFDIKAAGNSPGNFRLYLVRTFMSDDGGNFISLTSFTTSGVREDIDLGGGTFSEFTRGYTSVSLATDTRSLTGIYPSYCVSVTAAKAGSPNDSVVVWASPNGFATQYRRGLYASTKYIRTVSSSMGTRGLSTYPRLAVCWDEFDNAAAPWGDAKVMYLYGDDATYVTNEGPHLLNGAPNVVANPTIALSAYNEGGATPGGNDYRTVVVAERDNSDIGQGVNLYAVVSDLLLTGVPDFSTFSPVSEEAGDQVNPHLAYDVINDNFLLTYFDDATKSLVYKQKPLNGGGAVPFSIKTANYRNASNGMYNPFPRVDMGTTANGAVFVWNANDSTLFDAENSYVSVQESPLGLERLNLYPNPVQTQTTLAFAANTADKLQLRVVDITGKTVHTQTVQAIAGDNQITLNLAHLANGRYIIWIRGQHHNGSLSFIVSK